VKDPITLVSITERACEPEVRFFRRAAQRLWNNMSITERACEPEVRFFRRAAQRLWNNMSMHARRDVQRPRRAASTLAPDRSARGAAATGAEPGARRELRAAAGAERFRGAAPDRLAAARAELRPGLQLRPAARARAHHFDGGIEAGDLVDRAQLLGDLLRGDLRLLRGGLLGQIGRAVLAQLALIVPAHLGAHPVAASRALVKLRPDLLHRLPERAVPGLAAQAVLHELGGLPGRPQAATAEQAAEALGDLRPDAELGRVKRRAIAIAALVAMELELIAGVVAVVGVVTRERDTRHRSPVYRKPVILHPLGAPGGAGCCLAGRARRR